MSLGTKVLSVRVPFEFYVKLLEEAQRFNMTISDYVMIKINKDNSENISSEGVNAKIEALEHEIEKWQKDYKSLQHSNKELQSENKKYEDRYFSLLANRK